MDLGESIVKNISWIATMKQQGGYGGPVIHYWQDCLNYIGPSIDWRYEGLINAYVNLYKKTNNSKFIELAISCGDDIVKAQGKNVNFLNSAFESNPNFYNGSTPHESAACLGLCALVKLLKEKNLNYKKYLNAIELNLTQYHFAELYDKKSGLFRQYKSWQVNENSKNIFVPNKMATIAELFISLYELTGKIVYVKYAEKIGDYICKLQDREEFFGGIYQSDTKEKIITYYTARCIPSLIQLYGLTKTERYLQGAKDAGVFIKKQEDNGLFKFGYIKELDSFSEYKNPIFIAGSGDIVRSLLYLNEFDFKYDGKNAIKQIIANMNQNGGIRTAQGMLAKDSTQKNSKISWKDVVPVVGWNDKALRLFSELLEDETINFAQEFAHEARIACDDADFFEDKNYIEVTIEGKIKYKFGKKQIFSNGNQFVKSFVFNIAKTASTTNPVLRKNLAKVIKKLEIK